MAEAGIYIWKVAGNEHAPFPPLALASFERYADPGLGTTLMIYELSGRESLPPRLLHDAQETQRWSTISCRGSARYRHADVLFALWFRVPEPELGKFDKWYEEEHTPLLLDCGDWQTVRRFGGCPTAGGINRLVLHHLASEEALGSAARQRARATAGAGWFLAQEWFQQARKQVFRRTIAPAQP